MVAPVSAPSKNVRVLIVVSVEESGIRLVHGIPRQNGTRREAKRMTLDRTSVLRRDVSHSCRLTNDNGATDKRHEHTLRTPLLHNCNERHKDFLTVVILATTAIAQSATAASPASVSFHNVSIFDATRVVAGQHVVVDEDRIAGCL
jgi:hypothetical protein